MVVDLNMSHDYSSNTSAADDKSAESTAFFRIASVSTALALGCAAVVLQAMGQGTGGFSFRFSYGSVAAFAIGAAGGLFYWKVAVEKLRAKFRKSFFVGTAVAGLAMFLYPLRFVPREKLPDIAIGLTVAICVVSSGGIILWQIGKALRAEEKSTEKD
jgi:hypothetical protein